MGLDFKLSRNKYELFRGNGRNEFAFVREWVQSKGDDYYSEDILLTKEDIHWLIDKAIAQKCKNNIEKIEFYNKVVDSNSSEYITFAEELVAKLMLIDSIGDYSNYYLECDW